MRRAFRAFVLLCSALLAAASPGAAAGTAELLRDINVVETTTTYGISEGVAGPLVPAGNRIVFPASAPGAGGLWSSDGTALGTRFLRDFATNFYFFETVRQTALFATGDRFGPTPTDLWRSDGTAEGTFPLSSAGAGTPTACYGGDEPKHAVVKDLLFYTALGGSSPSCELWVSDGTRAGTRSVADIGEVGIVESFKAAGNRLFFVRRNPGPGLWTSDGTRAGTVLLQTFTGQPEGPRELTAAGSRVFFIARAAGSSDEELWTSDGTPAGTRPVTHFFEPLPFSYQFTMTVIDGVLYFPASDGTGFDLWRSDGTAAGTWRVTDFVEPFPFPGESEPSTGVARFGKRLVFSAREEGEAWRLWTSEGTPATTAPLEGCPGGCPQVFGSPMVRIGNRAVFAGSRASGRSDVWATDGTGSGTRQLAENLCVDYCNGSGFLSNPALVPLLGKVFFIAAGSRGFALWKTDGTPAGTVRLADLSSPYPDQSSGLGFAPVQAGGKMFFAADPGRRGLQLWSSDGTPGGSGLVTLIGGFPGSSPSELTPFAGGTLFTAWNGVDGELWRSDGTPDGTVPIAAATGDMRRLTSSGGLTFFLRSDSASSGPDELWRTDGTEAGTFRVNPDGVEPLETLVPFRGGAVFLANAAAPHGTTLWQSDGTMAGTRPLFDFVGHPRFFRSLGPDLYFVTSTGSDFDQLWVSDGTAAGTRPLTDFHSHTFDFHVPPEMARFGGTVFFAAAGRLWKTDGTVAGTVPALTSEREGSDPSSFVEFRGALFFIGGTAQGEVGRGLWRSDGTAAGTSLVKPVGPPVNFRLEPAWSTVVGDRLFFVADDGEHGVELWSSDGTPAGTVLVRDIVPGEASSRPSWLTAANGRLYFAADDGHSGNELWESDGTAAGTRRVQDIAPGAGSSSPRELTVTGNRLLFAADDGIHGEEPWVLDLAGGGCVPAADALCLGGRFRVEADWRDFQGNRGPGRAVALTADTGYFWFFDSSNVEVILKVLDGRGLNDHHWVFYGALSNVEYRLTVTDTQTGAVRRYINPPGRLGSVADTEAFGPRGASAAGVVTLGPAPVAAGEPITLLRTAPAATGSCTPGATRLCLNGGRFAVEARWKAQGQTGTSQAVPLAGGDTGYFWFFDATNVEVVLKVLDGRPLNGKFWVFYGALSNVEYTLTITDTVTGRVKTYTNPSGRLASVADTGAF